jgi:hypothetical protein
VIGWLVVIGMVVVFGLELAYFWYDNRQTKRHWAALAEKDRLRDEQDRLRKQRDALLRGRTKPCAFCGRIGQALGYDGLCQDVTSCLEETETSPVSA